MLDAGAVGRPASKRRGEVRLSLRRLTGTPERARVRFLGAMHRICTMSDQLDRSDRVHQQLSIYDERTLNPSLAGFPPGGARQTVPSVPTYGQSGLCPGSLVGPVAVHASSGVALPRADEHTSGTAAPAAPIAARRRLHRVRETPASDQRVAW